MSFLRHKTAKLNGHQMNNNVNVFESNGITRINAHVMKMQKRNKKSFIFNKILEICIII